MTVKDITRLTATLLGKENVVEYLDGNGKDYGDAVNQTDVIVRCVNMIINELACSYVPMIKIEKVIPNDGKVYFSSLTERAIKILSLKDGYGEEIAFKFFPDYLQTVASEVMLEYQYAPSNYGLDDRIGYSDSLPERIIAYGSAAEVCLIERAFEESVMWRKRFTDALSEIVKPKNVVVTARRWA